MTDQAVADPTATAAPPAQLGFGLFSAFLLGGAVLAGTAVYLDAHPRQSTVGTVLFLMACFLVIFALVAPFLVRAMRYAAEQRQKERAAENELIENATGRNTTLQQLIRLNFCLMDRFIGVALAQAKSAYLFCAVASCAGLLILLTGTAALLRPNTPAAQVTIGVLTAGGTALSGYISLTFVRTFGITAKQMSYYYGQPLVHCYLLHAEWLSNRSKGQDSTPYDQELVTATLEASKMAQAHLLDLVSTPSEK